jgi:DNA-directed RNA polymerase specialized sigma24 family protein
MSEAAHLMTGADGCRADGRDDAAVIGCSVRSPECFGAIFYRHGPAIYRYIARRLGTDSAEDLVAETFLVAFRRRGRYDCTFSDARPWLYGIATRLIGRHRRDEIRFFQAIARTGVDPASEALGVPAGTVSSRLVKARRVVREALGGADPTKPERGQA